MRNRPDSNNDSDRRQAVDDFISGADRTPGDEDDGGRMPWEESHVREDVRQNYPLRLPEPLYLKLKYVSRQTGMSMNELCNRAVEEIVDRKLSELM